MARFLVLALCAALSSAAPSYTPAVAISQGPTHVQEQVHAGPAIAKTHVQHGVVGHRQVQVGSQTVQVGHQYHQAGQTVQQAPAYSVIASPATNQKIVNPIPVPAAPVPAPYAAIPPAPVNLGPAPLDSVTQERVVAPARKHTIITPQVTRIEPQLSVNKYPVDVPRAIPVPVERVVEHTRTVPRPYTVEVPQRVEVPQPYPVNTYRHVVETPVVQKHTTHVQQPIHRTVSVAHTGYAGVGIGHAGGVGIGHGGVSGVSGIAGGIHH